TRLYDYPNLLSLARFVADSSSQAPAADPPEPSATPLRDVFAADTVAGRVRELLSKLLFLPVAELPEDVELLELGLDMVVAGELADTIQREFGMALKPSVLLGFANIRALSDAIAGAALPGAKPETRVSDIAIIGMAGRFPGARNVDE